MVSLLADDECDSWAVCRLQLCASLLDSLHFGLIVSVVSHQAYLKDLLELSLTHTIAVDEKSFRFESTGAIELAKDFNDHTSKVRNDFISITLSSAGSEVAGCFGIDAASRCAERRYPVLAFARVVDVHSDNTGTVR